MLALLTVPEAEADDGGAAYQREVDGLPEGELEIGALGAASQGGNLDLGDDLIGGEGVDLLALDDEEIGRGPGLNGGDDGSAHGDQGEGGVGGADGDAAAVSAEDGVVGIDADQGIAESPRDSCAGR